MSTKLTRSKKANKAVAKNTRRAKKAKQTEEAGVRRNYDQKARDAAIREAKGEVDQLTARMDALGATRSGFGKQRTKVFRNLKAELDMDREDAELAFKLIDLEKPNRDRTLLTIKEVFSALGVGEQASFMPALEQTGGAEPALTPFEAGRKASMTNQRPEDNPHPTRSKAHKEWERGRLSQAASAKSNGDKAFNEGEKAGRSGKAGDVNPYDAFDNAHAHERWADGWAHGTAANAPGQA